jgi:uncharacterized protein YodC (DUF2158 family)
MELKAGDQVRLKSGGPTMTVEHVGAASGSDGQAIACAWFETVDGADVLKRETFSSMTLEAPPPTGTISGRVMGHPQESASAGGGVISGRVTGIPRE